MSKNDELNWYAKRLAAGGLSRREFMGRAAALGVAAPLATSLAGGAAFAQATPKQGGRFVIAIGGGATSDTLDPATYYESYMQTVGYGLRNCLAEMNNLDELVPELAESWEASADAATWTVKLRKGVEFHSGKTFDADDAIASVQHHLGPDSKSAAKAILSTIESIEKDDSHTIRFKLSGGNVGFPALLTDYHVHMMPLVDGKLDTLSGDGTGAFVLTDFEAGQRTVMKRNPNYWKEGNGHFDEVVALSVTDVAARTNALATGEVHAADRLDLKTLRLLKRRPGIDIKDIFGSQWYGFPMMVDREPYSDPNLRLALKHAIDREELLQKLLYGHGSVANDNPIGRSYRFYAELPQHSYDVDKAKFYLKKANMENVKVELHAADAAFAGAVDAGTLFSESARKCGIDMTVVRVPNDGYWSNVNRVKPWTATYWNPRVTEDMMFSTAISADAPWNESNWKDPRFNTLLKEARVEFDADKRAQMYREMQQLCTEENGYIIPLFANYVFATSDKVAHNKLATSWDLDGTKCLERWWFA
ncbi:MAG: ABC transporter substrate-binding protein [Rhodospirillales bacterium]